MLFCTAPLKAEWLLDRETSSGSSPSLNELPLIRNITCNGTSAIHIVNIWEDAFPGEVQSCPRWPHVLRRSSAALDVQGNLMACQRWALVKVSKAVEKLSPQPVLCGYVILPCFCSKQPLLGHGKDCSEPECWGNKKKTDQIKLVKFYSKPLPV